jgi:hypothetical protein
MIGGQKDLKATRFPKFTNLSVRRPGFCNSSDFSSLAVGVEAFADYFANIYVPSVQIPSASEHVGDFTFS